MEIVWLYEWPIWVNGVIFLVLLGVATEIGFRLGLRRYLQSGKDANKVVRGDVTLTSMLALLGLLLAFTYAFSLSRADMRKQAMVQEANAIGTAFLRADFGMEPGRSELRQNLLGYARSRVVHGETLGKSLQDSVAHSMSLQAQLWPSARRAAGEEIPAPMQVSLLQSVNEVLDAHTVRLAVINDRIPGAVLAMLLLVAAASLAVAAHNAGLNGFINRWRMNAFSLVLVALVLIIVDFDRGQRGLIQISLEPLEDVIADMQGQIKAD